MKRVSSLRYTPVLTPRRSVIAVPQLLPWAEVKEDEAIYKTNLKRVRYHSGWDNFLDDNLAHKQWETIKVKQIKAGSLRRLVEHFTSVESAEADPGFFMAFLCTYKSFATPVEVVRLLVKRFVECEQAGSVPNAGSVPKAGSVSQHADANIIKRRICSTFTIWMEQYPHDFDEPPSYEALVTLVNFAKDHCYFPPWKEVLQKSEQKLTVLRVSPYEDEEPFKFKFCSCETIIGCTCSMKTTFTISHCLDKTEDELLLGSIGIFSAPLIAEQLTLVDAELFLRVVPRECLGCFWSRRDKATGDCAVTIKRTVDHFNAVSLRVVSTILNSVDPKTHLPSALIRCKLIEKWIDTAQGCRELKNFSSLKAILSGLQSASIFRLKQSWELLKRSSMDLYEELSQIFSDDLNMQASRELLIQEGTAKYAYGKGSVSKKRFLAKKETLIKEGVVHGTVPYLGTFLTDLMMIDTAFHDYVEGGLINFEKRRKEFEIVVQIKMLQEAAKNYAIDANQNFFRWFNSLNVYSDKEAYLRSVEVEPSKLPGTPNLPRKTFAIRRYVSESDIVAKVDGLSHSLSMFSVSSVNLFRSASQDSEVKLESRHELSPVEPLTCNETGVTVRIFLEGSDDVRHKSIEIMPFHRAIDVINNALIQFKCKDDPDEFSLIQLRASKKALHIPLHANVFYACCKGKDMVFTVSKKKLKKKLHLPLPGREEVSVGTEGKFKLTSIIAEDTRF